MQGKITNIAEIFASQNTYAIPIYQRSYCWEKEQIEQFFQDIMEVCRSEEKNAHFIGTINLQVIRQSNRSQFYIIDGQQRLTTILLMLLAIRNLLEKENIQTKNDHLRIRIEQDYLFTNHECDSNHSRLIPLAKDKEDYFKLLSMKVPRRESNIVKNYKYFLNQIPKQGIDPDKIFLALTNNISAMQVVLEPYENAQQIFESLNSTGLDLTEVDKIKNFLLMSKSLEEQKCLYEVYWLPIEQATEAYQEEFFQNYLWLKQGKYTKPPKGSFYSLFKNFRMTSKQKEEDFFKELLHYAELYQKIVLDSSSLHSQIDAILYRLRLLNHPAPKPFILSLLNLHFTKDLSNDQLVSMLKTLETYIFRRGVCSISNQGFYSFMAGLETTLHQLEGNHKNYDLKLQAILSEQTVMTHFPSDEEFKHGFSTYNFMGTKNYLWYAFHCLESYESKESSVDIIKEFKNKTYSIEHILPQTLNTEWKETLGENYEEIHKNWLHRIANLTLTGYNSKLSNHSFIHKRDFNLFGFKSSGLKLNQWIAQQEKWGEEELKDRDQYLIQCALNIWPWHPIKRMEKSSPLNQLSFSQLPL